MGLLFNRKYELYIGKPDIVVRGRVPPPVVDGASPYTWAGATDWVKTTPDAVLITDLQFTAEIDGSSNNSKSSTNSTIKIYNLSKETKEKVERENNYIVLKAGYEEDEELKTLFVGQVFGFETMREGQNQVTTLQCTEAYSTENSIKVSKDFPQGKTYSDVFKYLIGVYEDNGVPLGDFVEDWTGVTEGVGDFTQHTSPQNYVQLPVIRDKPKFSKLIYGYSITGFLHQAMERLCKQTGFVSYITNGRLFVHPKGFTRMVELFEFSSQQMKSIRRFGSLPTNSSVGKGVNGVTITTFLDGRLDIDKRIKILDGDFENTYKVLSKKHVLDYEGATWDTTITCLEDTV